MTKVNIQKDIPSVVLPRHWLIGEPTRLLDRVEPLIEESLLPVYETFSGQMRLQYDGQETTRKKVFSEPSRKFKSLIRRPNEKQIECPKDYSCLDLRRNSPKNWAHAFTNHLPIALLIADELDIPSNQICVLLPGETPKKIIELFELVQFAVLTSNGPVKGKFCQYGLDPWLSIRSVRCEVLRKTLSSAPISDQIQSTEHGKPKLFISRKDARKVVNEQEIETHLVKRGFEKIYPEDYALVDQIALIAQAEEIVAVHGAGLGPLVFKAIVDRPYKLLELFSPAHVTNVYRLVAHQTGGEWIGVRGNVWPSLLTKKAKFFGNMQDFEVSIEALERAMEIQSGGQTSIPS